jgi:uncharacterized protein (DUF302 family)
MRRELPDTPYETAVQRVTDALKSEGFGVLTEIDVRTTFRQKLDVDFRPYVILGACNPQLAHRALTEDAGIGLLLPCNVVVSATETGSEVIIARPQAMLGIADIDGIQSVAEEAEARLSRVLDRV